MSKIVTQYWPKPIPDRRFDWMATDENYEPGYPSGFGATEEEAIAEFKQELADWIEWQEHKRGGFFRGLKFALPMAFGLYVAIITAIWMCIR